MMINNKNTIELLKEDKIRLENLKPTTFEDCIQIMRDKDNVKKLIANIETYDQIQKRMVLKYMVKNNIPGLLKIKKENWLEIEKMIEDEIERMN